jgi:mRNA interferase RelE/StbE
MNHWGIFWVDSAEKYFLRLRQKDRDRVKDAILNLKFNPTQGLHIKKLHSHLEGLYRCRVGKLRIIYRILQKQKVIRIIALGVRGDVYK